MSRNQRYRQVALAKILRSNGETVTLLISSDGGTKTDTRSTPLSATVAQIPPVNTSDTRIPIYARVTYKTFGDISYNAAGRVTNQIVEIESSMHNKTQMSNCYGVELNDGTQLKKTSERWSDGRESFIITCSEYANGTM